MSRRSDPARIETARRAATIARLISDGELPDRAAAWVARWELTVTGRPGRTDWESFDQWIALERLRARDPPSG